MNNQSDSNSDAPIPPWGRTLARVTAVLFFISSAFPVAASLSKDTSVFPKWWGVLDVSLALILAILAFVMYGLAQGNVTKRTEEVTYHVYRNFIHVIFALLLIFFIVGDRITWINGLPGIAWRSWLLLYLLPEWLTLVQNTPS